MDVRCEKCQTEYELDEARLKPGGVTVKCTNCGHMFKIRKRTITNVGTTPPVPSILAGPPIPSVPRDARETVRPRSALGKPRADSMLDDSASFDEMPTTSPDEPTTAIERHWLIRLDNGEQKTCRELATLQQWIITSVVTREALISRTGKTWKRLGDIADLSQYFTIADEARATRERTRQASRPGPKEAAAVPSGTLPGYSAAGGTILPDDDADAEEVTRSRASPQRPGAPTPTPPPVPSRGGLRTPPAGAPIPVSSPIPLVAPARTPAAMSATVPQTGPLAPPPRGPRTTPPPPPAPHGKRAVPPSGPVPHVAHPPAIPPPIGRETAAWAVDAIVPGGPGRPTTTQPFTGNLSAVPDEPAFAGRVRIAPGDESTFATGKVRALDDDDGVMRVGRGSRAGMLVLVMALLVMGAGAAVVYLFVIRQSADDRAAAPKDAGATVANPVTPAAPDAAAAVAPPPAVLPPGALDAARGELAGDLEPRLRSAAQELEAAADPASLALRAQLLGQLAQDLQDRAQLVPDRAEGDALRTSAKQLVLDAATAAQRALKAAGDDASANLAMAEVLRLQGKPAHDVARYLDTARTKADPAWKRDLALGDALVLVRDGKLDDARAALAAIDQGDDKLESSGDVRARLHLALVLAAQSKPAEARPLVDSVLAARPDHAAARALAAKLETAVAKTDPLPQEDSAHEAAPSRPAAPAPVAVPTPAIPVPHGGGGGGGESYERLLARANAIADTSCTKAMELYTKALEQKPNGAEALTGMGYCHIDGKQFASAFSKFRSALAVSPRYEPALRGIAEAYQQQGRKEQAIEAYRAYLEAYPDSAAAKKQLERLGGDPGAPAASPSGPVTDPGAGSAPD